MDSPQESPRPSISPDDSDWQVPEVPVAQPGSGISEEGGWQPDHQVSHCPLCNTRFSRTFRKHHCRQCGRVVCETCSPQRLRLPKLPKEGKVRVCNPCVGALGERQAEGFEEDLAAYDESIATLRHADRKVYEDCEVFKRVLLELDAEASGNMGLVEEHFLDPETHLASFDTLKERAQKQWAGLLDARIQEKVRHQELLDRHQDSLQRVEQARGTEEELKVKKASLMEQVKLVDIVEAERDELTRRQSELEQAIEEKRRRVRELETRRQARQEVQQRQQQQAANRQDRWRPFSFGGSAAPNTSSSPERRSSPVGSTEPSPLMAPHQDPEAFTITAGQGDPWNQQSRLDGCRRTARQSCVVM